MPKAQGGDVGPSSSASIERQISELQLNEKEKVNATSGPCESEAGDKNLEDKSFAKSSSTSGSPPQALPVEYFRKLLSERKLVLLVDLDKTLIDSTLDVRATHLEGVSIFNYGSDLDSNRCLLTTIVRPFVSEFLKHTAPLYELFVCTTANRRYAEYILELIDPDRRFFNRLAFTRDDSELVRAESKTRVLDTVFGHGRHLAVMMDDRSDVWADSPSLVRVKPYCFFKKAGGLEAFKALPSSLEAFPKASLKDGDVHLRHLQASLAKIHKAYFRRFAKEERVRTEDLLPSIRKDVLTGTRIAIDKEVYRTNPEENKEKLFRRLVAVLGGRFEEELAEGTTHFVCEEISLNGKANLPANVQIVNPDWLWVCAQRLERAGESGFPCVTR